LPPPACGIIVGKELKVLDSPGHIILARGVDQAAFRTQFLPNDQAGIFYSMKSAHKSSLNFEAKTITPHSAAQFSFPDESPASVSS
jgi:3-hydroxymyristoyl/3-hydroxydecanoyl-(acyl carrier protein) dehydratase